MNILKKIILYTLLLCMHCALVPGPQKPSQHPMQITLNRIEQNIERSQHIEETLNNRFTDLSQEFENYKQAAISLYHKKETIFKKLDEYAQLLDEFSTIQMNIQNFIQQIKNYSQHRYETLFKPHIDKLITQCNSLVQTIHETLNEQYPKTLDDIQDDFDNDENLTTKDLQDMLSKIKTYKDDALNGEFHEKLYNSHKDKIETLEKDIQKLLKEFQKIDNKL